MDSDPRQDPSFLAYKIQIRRYHSFSNFILKLVKTVLAYTYFFRNA